MPPDPADGWFTATAGGECGGCGEDILEGDEIRSDDEGGWLCGLCGLDDGDGG